MRTGVGGGDGGREGASLPLPHLPDFTRGGGGGASPAGPPGPGNFMTPVLRVNVPVQVQATAPSMIIPRLMVQPSWDSMFAAHGELLAGSTQDDHSPLTQAEYNKAAKLLQEFVTSLSLDEFHLPSVTKPSSEQQASSAISALLGSR